MGGIEFGGLAQFRFGFVLEALDPREIQQEVTAPDGAERCCGFASTLTGPCVSRANEELGPSGSSPARFRVCPPLRRSNFWFRVGTSFFYFAGGFQLRRTWIGSAGALSSSVTIKKRPSRETSY